MGVIDPIPRDLLALYGDDYYGLAGSTGCPGASQGYADYAYTAEHGVGWATALVKLLRPGGGRILDVGCADGHLLAKLGPGYDLFGIEVNEASGRIAAERGVVILGREVEDPILVEHCRGSFDVVTAIAVFEHLRDIRAGMEAALHLLRGDGVLLFEVPLMSEAHDNRVWITSSLEHVWYPAERSLRRLVETELGAQMVGAEVFVTGYASTYIALVFREAADGPAVRELAARVLLRTSDPASADEATARMLLHLVHAATATHSDVGNLANLTSTMLNPQLMRRFADLWQADLERLALARAETCKARACERRLKADLDVVKSDHIRNDTELTAALVTAQARLTVAEADLAARIAAETDLGHQRSALNHQRAAADAALREANAIRAHPAWGVAMILFKGAQRHPRLAHQVVRAARVFWWTLRGRLITRLRFRQQVRAQLRAETSVERLNPGTALAPAGPGPAILDVTGHRPAVAASEEQPGDWPLISVVVTSFNYGPFVAQAVDSILAQTFKDLEVIVVEGGSTHPASRFLAASLQRARTRVLMQGTSHPAGANRNFGISQARGRYICCLDADDTLAPTYIEKAVFLLERHGYDVVSGGMAMVGMDYGQIAIMEQPDLEHILAGNEVLTCAVFRRSYWEKAGGYRDVDRTLSGHVHEDWAFWVRLAGMGARFRNLHHDAVLRYRIHRSSLSRDADVLPMVRQRDMVQQMNRDVLEPLDERIALSKMQASIRYGTPSAPPAPIILDRDPPGTHPPTLLLAMPFLILGGAERLLSAVVAFLVKTGWRVVIATSVETNADDGDTTPWFEGQTLEIFHLPRFLPPDLWEDFIHHLVGSRSVDVLWVVGSAFAYACLRSLKATFPRLRVADLLFNTVGHTANNRRRRDQIDLIFVENREVQNWLLAGGEETTRVRLIESGVDLGALRPTARSGALVHEIGAARHDLIVGFSGRWSEEKNPLGFVEIARRVDPSLPVRFVMTGTGHQRPVIEQAVREAQFPDGRFDLLGKAPEIVPVLASFDLLVIPSAIDGRPIVALEALALGVPVLASRVGALPDIIDEGRTGWLCEPNDLEAFCGWIEHANRNRALLQDMRRHARAYAEAKLDIKKMLMAYQGCLTSLLPEEK